jgi:hypothetical protein
VMAPSSPELLVRSRGRYHLTVAIERILFIKDIFLQTAQQEPEPIFLFPRRYLPPTLGLFDVEELSVIGELNRRSA